MVRVERLEDQSARANKVIKPTMAASKRCGWASLLRRHALSFRSRKRVWGVSVGVVGW